MRFQIKTIQNDKRNGKILPVRKTYHYTANDIDYFIGSDIEEESLYICPISFIEKYKSAIGIKALQPYKNNFKQLENTPLA